MKQFSLAKLLPRVLLIIFFFACSGKLLAEYDMFQTIEPKESLPAFSLPLLGSAGSTFSNKDIATGQVALLNVWASWCGYCHEEHPLLLQVRDKYHIPVYGIDLSDNPHAALRYLAEHGNPYTLVGSDEDGSLANAIGVTGTPATYILDKHGMIRYKRVGMMDRDVWENVFLPLIKQYQAES
jgi:cytochrome c biogenesis protein CcmG/thiol:disulfide interchange protein DsbE